ncbi:MAG: fluoride efflux transporter FluC [Flavobacteriaceae bacterium]
MIYQFTLVFLGGGLGAGLRWVIRENLTHSTDFPWATLLANAIGCLFLGLMSGWSSKTLPISQDLVLFFAVGFCGGLTTFSSFMLENINYADLHKWILLVTYSALSFFIGGLLLGLGRWLARTIV